MSWELCNVEAVMVRELESKATQKTVALTYAFALISSEKIDFKKINQLIIKRWSLSGLDRVMKMAWKLVEEKGKKNGSTS